MCVSFQYTDCVTVLHLNDAGLSIIRQAINETWKAGISVERSRCGSGWSFKLCGNPFKYFTSSEVSQQARQMVCQILQKLYESGWKIIVSGDLGRFEDKSTLFFKQCPSEFSTLPFLCVGLSSSNKLQIVNLPSQLVEPIKETIRSSWALGIQKETSTNDVLIVKLRGNPWRATEQQSVMAKVLLQNIIATLRCYQWVYYCNVNLRKKADSLFFRHDSNTPQSQFVSFCTISLNQDNLLRLIDAPYRIVTMIRDVIKSTWLRGGIQDERCHPRCREFMLSGDPWCSVNEESVMARYLVLKILEAMLDQGWHNIVGIDTCRRDTEKSVLIFQGGEPQRRPMMCLSLNGVDKFRLINMPTQLVDLFKQTLVSRWSKGIEEETELVIASVRVCQLKLFGRPWSGGESNDTIHARSFLCNIIEEFIEQGWRPFHSANVSPLHPNATFEHNVPVDVHSIWFVYDPPSSAQPSALSNGLSKVKNKFRKTLHL